MKKIIFLVLLILYGLISGGSSMKTSLIEILLPYIEFNKELNSEIKNFFKDISEITKLREENFILRNKEFVYVSKDFKEKIDNLNLLEYEKLKKSIEVDDFFKNKRFEITDIVYLDKSNSKLYIKKVGDYKVGDSVLMGRFYLGKIVSITENLYEVDLWNRRENIVNSYIITKTSGQLVMNIRSENFNTSYIDNILSTEDVQVGDIISTSSTNDGIPKNLFIGSIDRVEGVSSQTFRKALIKKEYDLEKSNYVLILKND